MQAGLAREERKWEPDAMPRTRLAQVTFLLALDNKNIRDGQDGFRSFTEVFAYLLKQAGGCTAAQEAV